MKQEALVTVFGLSFSSYCEKLITDTYENNSRKVRLKSFRFKNQDIILKLWLFISEQTLQILSIPI